MINPVKMAKANLTMETGTVVRWHKNEGEYIKQDEILLEIETDKAVIEVPSFYTGYIKKIVVPEGREVPVETVIAYIGDLEDKFDDFQDSPEQGGKADIKYQDSPGHAEGTVGRLEKKRIHASPVAKKLAKELGIDIAKISGTGPDGRIGKEDILRAAQKSSQDEPHREEISAEGSVNLTGVKKVVAKRMLDSYRSAPHFHLNITIDMTRAEEYRLRKNRNTQDIHITVSDLFLKASAESLSRHSTLNSMIEGETIHRFRNINIGLASDTEKGLVVPVFKNIQNKSVTQIAEERKNLIHRVRKGEQTPEDLEEGTFTITNLGMFGIDSFDPILFPGQAAILSIGSMQTVPAAVNGDICLRNIIKATLACDHRIIDGAEGARFLAELKGLMEKAEFNEE